MNRTGMKAAINHSLGNAERNLNKNSSSNIQLLSHTHSQVNVGSNLGGIGVVQSNKNLHATMSTSMQPSHNRRKLPIGFLVQQEKRELHKMGMTNGGKLRPDSAKVTLGGQSKKLLTGDV